MHLACTGKKKNTARVTHKRTNELLQKHGSSLMCELMCIHTSSDGVELRGEFLKFFYCVDYNY